MPGCRLPHISVSQGGEVSFNPSIGYAHGFKYSRRAIPGGPSTADIGHDASGVLTSETFEKIGYLKSWRNGPWEYGNMNYMQDDYKINSDEANAVGMGLSTLDVFFEQSARRIEVPYAAYKVSGTGKAFGMLGNALTIAALAQDSYDYQNGDMSASRLGYHFGSAGAAYAAEPIYGGVPGIIVGAGFYTAEVSYDGVIWYGDQLSRGSVNFTNALNRGWRFGR